MAQFQHPYTAEYLSRHPTHFDNTPTHRHLDLMKVMSFILFDLSSIVGRQLIVGSCYRHPVVNSAMGGKPGSFHCCGSAVDILTTNLTDSELSTLVRAIDSYHPAEFICHPRHFHVAFDVSRLGNYGKIKTWQEEFPDEFPTAQITSATDDSDL